MDFLVEELEQEMTLEGEIVEVHASRIRSISVNETVIEPDPDQNVEIPVDAIIGAYLQENLGAGLKLEGEQLAVDMAEQAEEGNTKPITSAAVYAELGNISALLQRI